MTIRRDVSKLEEQGLLVSVSGGVRAVSACKGRGVLRWKEREIEIPAADDGPVEVLVK